MEQAGFASGQADKYSIIFDAVYHTRNYCPFSERRFRLRSCQNQFKPNTSGFFVHRQDSHLDLVPSGQDLFWMIYAAAKSEIRKMNESLDAGLQFNKSSEIH